MIENKCNAEIAEEINKAKRMFLSNMSHEMRTPLNVILGLTYFMLEDENLALNFKENLTKISIAGNTLLGQITDVLNNSTNSLEFGNTTPIGEHSTDEEKPTIKKKPIRPDLSYAKVLVVDDMQVNLDVAAALLGKYKMQVDCVLNGEEAIERIYSGQKFYNAIFMDYMMPGMDGIETATSIRHLGTEYAQKIPIIALTANAIAGTEDMFYVNGFQDFLSKPIDIMKLDTVVLKWIPFYCS